VDQLYFVPSGKSSDSGSWEMGTAAVRFPELCLAATGPDYGLALAMIDNLASI
jgi:hypothetical protein